MSRTIFADIEEAILREVRRITFHESRTLDKVYLEDTFDPFTGEQVDTNIEPSVYDSSANTGHIQYPHFFVKLQKTREDRFTGRAVPQYGKWCRTPVRTSPRAYEIVAGSVDAVIPSDGNIINTSLFTINKIVPGYLLRLLSGSNKGTYIVDSITPDILGNHAITVSNVLLQNLQEFIFDSSSRTLSFPGNIDLNTVAVGDVFVDNSSNSFNITSVNVTDGTIVIDGASNPDTSEGSSITRTGDVLTADATLVRFIIMDSQKPVTALVPSGTDNATSNFVGTSPQIPIDAFYLVRIDSKEQSQHIEILNRMWEEFNPPRTALPVVVRTALSAEQALTEDVASGGSTTIKVEDNTDFNVGDTVVIIDDFVPTKEDCGFQEPFSSVVESKNIALDGTHEIILKDTVPDTFLSANCSKIISNVEFQLLMFHFVDHNTKDIEGSQYWVHEFTFWVQLYVDRLETAKETGVVTDVNPSVETVDEVTIL